MTKLRFKGCAQSLDREVGGQRPLERGESWEEDRTELLMHLLKFIRKVKLSFRSCRKKGISLFLNNMEYRCDI